MKDKTDIGLKYFSHKELKCPGSGLVMLAPGFGEKLDELREAWGKPLHVNSCCRSIQYNKQVGGAKGSYHIYDLPGRTYKGSCAVDLHFLDSEEKGDFVALAWKMGWSVEPRSTWVHVDRRVDYGAPKLMFTK